MSQAHDPTSFSRADTFATLTNHLLLQTWQGRLFFGCSSRPSPHCASISFSNTCVTFLTKVPAAWPGEAPAPVTPVSSTISQQMVSSHLTVSEKPCEPYVPYLCCRNVRKVQAFNDLWSRSIALITRPVRHTPTPRNPLASAPQYPRLTCTPPPASLSSHSCTRLPKY